MLKRLLCALLTLALLMLTAASLAEETHPDAPGNRLGFSVLAQLADGSGNQFVSPVSLAFCLALAARGAEGETRDALLAALDAEDAKALSDLGRALEASGLRWANAAFVTDAAPLREDYADAIRADFDGEIFPLDSAERVNEWVKAHTDGLIDGILNGPLDPSILLALVNAIAMDAKWQIPFEHESTWKQTFHAPAGDREIDFMHNTLFAAYGEAEDTQFLRLDYVDSSLSMYLALPPEGGIPAALSALAEQGMGFFALGDEPREVRLSLPKLDVSADNTLDGALKALGLSLPFEPAADFSGISDTPLLIDSVLQKVRVQVDEEGTRAAAVTAIILAEGAAMEEDPPVPMTLDRPFILVIADGETGAVAFAGVVAEP